MGEPQHINDLDWGRAASYAPNGRGSTISSAQVKAALLHRDFHSVAAAATAAELQGNRSSHVRTDVRG